MNVKVNIRSDRERKQENKLTRYVCTLFSAEGWYLCLYPLETIVSMGMGVKLLIAKNAYVV